MVRFLWVVTILGCLAGGVALTLSFVMPSAPQQGAVAAIAVGMGVLPYCLARATSELGKTDRPVAQPPAQSPNPPA